MYFALRNYHATHQQQINYYRKALNQNTDINFKLATKNLLKSFVIENLDKNDLSNILVKEKHQIMASDRRIKSLKKDLAKQTLELGKIKSLFSKSTWEPNVVIQSSSITSSPL